MRVAHKKLVEEKGLNDTHFDAIAELLAATLKDLGVGQDLIDEVMIIAGSTRNDVLNKPEQNDLSLQNTTGVIENNYSGEIQVLILYASETGNCEQISQDLLFNLKKNFQQVPEIASAKRVTMNEYAK